MITTMRNTKHLVLHKKSHAGLLHKVLTVVPEHLCKLQQKSHTGFVHQSHKHPGIRHGKPRQLLMRLHQGRGSSLHGHLECN
ncbi:hypothetical protein AAFF_G00075170 [Aldrovandia affinis]|uniref:Uncharacterized protein n=1 Tax=Aldrovandia affinis TaxID=143900 RepID=A0AAD7RY79_9TELE|nr:hypothetical protein AAFF_G00075170 [Aldrovandia affinis]